MADGNVIIEHSKEVKSQIYQNMADSKSKILTEENDDWKYVSITPPPKAPIPKNGLISIESLPKFA